MPGVGVAPGLKGFLSSAGLGIPGVGVAPFVIVLAAFGSGMPGVVLADGGIGFTDSPSGKLFASTVTFPTPTASLAFVFALVVSVDEPHAEIKAIKDKSSNAVNNLDIKINLFKFKIAVPV